MALQELGRRKKANLIKQGPPDLSAVSSLITRPGHPFHDLLRNARYKVYYGGRGAAKSWAFAEALIRRAIREPIRVLCTREYQNSIKDSVHRVLVDTIARLGLQAWFIVTEKDIKSIIGAEFMFTGLHHNADEIRSKEGATICWVAEAHNTSEDSWKVLIPTIRQEKKGPDGKTVYAEIWIEFNVTDEEAPTYKRFVTGVDLLRKYWGADQIVCHKVNYTENPFFPDSLRLEMEFDKENDYEAYEWIWLGHPRKISDAVIFGKRYKVWAFDDMLWKKAERLFYGADFGFANDPSTLIRSFILDDELYIDYESYGVGVELDDMGVFWEGGKGSDGREWEGVPEARKWEIKCDNARPETISHMCKKHRFRAKAAEKWKGSVEDGIAHIKKFRRINIHERCKHTAQEARLYSFKKDPRSGEVLPIIVDRHNHTFDAVRYSLDGHILRKGNLEMWRRLGKG